MNQALGICYLGTLLATSTTSAGPSLPFTRPAWKKHKSRCLPESEGGCASGFDRPSLVSRFKKSLQTLVVLLKMEARSASMSKASATATQDKTASIDSVHVKADPESDGGIVHNSVSVANGEMRKGSVTPELPFASKRRYYGALSIFLISMILSWMWLSFSMVNEFSQEHFNVGPQEINWFSVIYCFLFVWFYVGSWMASRYGYKPTLLVSASLTLVGSWVRVAGTWKHNFAGALIGQALLASAGPFVMALPTAYSGIWFAPKERTTATAAMSMSAAFGTMLGSLVTPYWATSPEQLPWSILYVSVMATVFSLMCIFVPAAPPTSLEGTTATDHGEQHESMGSKDIWHYTLMMLKSLEFWLIASPFIIGLAFFNAWASLISLILYPYGFSLQTIGVISSIQTGSGIVAAIFIAPFIDRWGLHVKAFKIFQVLMAGIYVALVFVPPTRSMAFASVIMILAGIVGSSSQAVILELLAEVVYPVPPSLTSGPVWGMGNILGGAMLFAMTALQDGENGDPPYNLQRALYLQAAVCGFFFLISTLLGCCGRSEKVQYKRRMAHERVMAARQAEAQAQV